MSARPGMSPEKIREMQERTKERDLIIRQIRDRGSSTVEELSNGTGIEKPKLLKHLIALRQFGKVLIVGERDSQLLYDLPEEDKK